MASDKQKVLVGFVCGTVFAVAGLASWFAARPQSRSPLTSDPTSRCPDLQPQPTSTSWGPAEDTSSGQFLIYTCAKENSFCGGLGDRQKGLAAIFLLAIVTNRRFGIRLTTPCDVRQFYLPNLYNWIVDDKELAGKTRRAIRCIDTCALGKDLFTSDFNAQYPEDVIFITTNIDFYKAITANPRYSESLPMWARQRPLSQFFHDAWQILMKPSPLLQQRLASFLTSIGFTTRTQPLVGLHLRVGRSASMSDTEVRLNVDIIGVEIILCLSVSLSPALFLSASLSFCLCLSISRARARYLSLSLSLSVSLFLSRVRACYLSMFLCISLSLAVSLYLSLAVPL